VHSSSTLLSISGGAAVDHTDHRKGIWYCNFSVSVFVISENRCVRFALSAVRDMPSRMHLRLLHRRKAPHAHTHPCRRARTHTSRHTTVQTIAQSSMCAARQQPTSSVCRLGAGAATGAGVQCHHEFRLLSWCGCAHTTDEPLCRLEEVDWGLAVRDESRPNTEALEKLSL